MASVRAIKAGAAYVELFVNDSKLVRGLEVASRKLKAFGAAITGMGQKLAAIGAAVTAPLVGSAKVFSEMGDQMAKMSGRTGISVETLSELAVAAQLSGADVEVLETSIQRMQKTLIAAGKGSKGAVKALADLGLTVEDFRGLSPDQQFRLIADRISKIPSPAARASAAMQILGRSGAQLLPMMASGAAGIEALQQQARDLGLTMSTEDAKAAEALNDSFDLLWKVVKQGVFAIGLALAPTLREIVETITRVIVNTTAWVRENRGLILTLFRIAAGVLAGGAALMVIGYAVSAAGTAFEILAAAIGGVGTVIGVMGSVLAWVLSPMGVVIVAAAALGAYLIYASGAGGQALSWLGERFNELKEFATAAFGGIADALMAGDIGLAARILWLSLKIAWEKGIGVLQSAWLSFKHGFMKIAYGAFYGAQAAWEIFNHGLTVAWIETTAFLSSTWTRFTSMIMSVWESTQNWLAKRWIDLMGLFDETLDTDAAKSLLDKGGSQALAQIEQEKQKKLVRGRRLWGSGDLVMGDHLKRVRSGQKLRIAASAYNAFVDAVVAQRQKQQDRGGEAVEGPRWDSGVLLVRNESGANRDRFETLAVSGVVITPAQNLAEFASRPCLKGTLPSESGLTRLAVLLRPLKPNEIGPAVVDGVAIARVNVAAEGDELCDSKASSATLQSGSGPVEILWKESGTGQRLALVRLVFGGSGGALPVGQYDGMVWTSPGYFSFVKAHAIL